MDLYLIRHGPAAERAAFARTERPDEERPLTDAGREKMLANVRGLRAVVTSFDALITSPYARAVQTADIIARGFDGPRPEPLKALAPDGGPEELLRWLRAHPKLQAVAAVGHEPALGALLAWFVTGTESPFVDLKKGGVCMITWKGVPAPGKAKLRWLLSPAMLRRLAR